MTRLTAVELRRLASRRLVVAAAVAAVLITGLVLLGTWTASRPMNAAQLEQAERAYAQAQADWAENGEEMVAECEEAEQRETEATGTDVDFGCESMEPQREWFFFTAPPFEENLPALLGAVTALVVVVAFAIGTTFVAAEISTGALSNWLTFEPRRTRVYASKLTAAAVGVLPLAVVVLALLVLGAWWIHDHHGLADGMTRADWLEAGGSILRLVVLGAFAAVVGAALGFLLRHTAAVLGLAVGYAVVAEGILAAIRPAVRPWLPQLNMTAWVQGGASYFTEECAVGATGTSCQMVEQTLSLGQSAAYLGVLVVVLVAVGALVFRHRDVG